MKGFRTWYFKYFSPFSPFKFNQNIVFMVLLLNVNSEHYRLQYEITNFTLHERTYVWFTIQYKYQPINYIIHRNKGILEGVAVTFNFIGRTGWVRKKSLIYIFLTKSTSSYGSGQVLAFWSIQVFKKIGSWSKFSCRIQIQIWCLKPKISLKCVAICFLIKD